MKHKIGCDDSDDQRVGPIEHAAMPGNEIARILDTDTSFNATLEQIAEHSHDGYNHAAENGEPEVDLIQARPPDDDPNDDGTKKTAEETMDTTTPQRMENQRLISYRPVHQMMIQTTTEPRRQPKKPSQLFFGDILGSILCLPKRLPTM